MELVRLALNGIEFTFDRATGALAEMALPGVGPMQKLGEAGVSDGLVDMAWPVHYEYETMRANPCGASHRKAPVIEGDGERITITYDGLPQSFDVPEIEEELKGRVYARIEIKALEDGKSVSLRCAVKNNSKTPVVQVVFPNFDALVPTDTKENARMTMMGGVINPYTYGAPRGTGGQWNSGAIRTTGLMLTPSGLQTGPLVGRWYDWGSYRGGFSLYRRHWGWDAEDPGKMGEADPTWVRYDAVLDQVRIAGVHQVNIPQGGEYDSGEYVLTAHTGPWIFGAEPYKRWLHDHVKRVVPIPRRVKEMMGFRSLVMTNYPRDPRETVCDYKELPELAADTAEHGLFDLNVWKGFNYTLPLTEDCFYGNWGGLPAWNEAVRRCREIGVTVTAFVSWLSLWSETCDNYGITKRSGSWAGSRHLIPRFQAPYAEKWACWQLWDHTHPRWAKDVLDGLRFLRDRAECPTISWDQYVLGDNSDNTLHDIINEYRLETEKMYPGTAWSAESTLFFESELDSTDFTWNGLERTGGRWDWDLRAFMHIVAGMRPNVNVGEDPIDTKYAFMDNGMLNLGVGKPGTVKWARISDFPEVSRALKTCYRLRTKYLAYFADGEALGDCVLSAECGAHVTAYRHDGKIALFFLQEDGGEKTLKMNLAPFIGDGERRAVIRGEDEEVISEQTIAADGTIRVTAPAGELRIIEIA